MPIDRFSQEPAYCAALASQLEGVAYQDVDAQVEFKATVVADRSRSTEWWSGADLAITAEVADSRVGVRKAILVQAKRGALEELDEREKTRLLKQIADMRALTGAPKVMDIRKVGSLADPGVYSGNGYAAGASPVRFRLSDYMVRRVLPTLDGDTRPHFVNGVQDSYLTTLRVYARRFR